MLRTDGQRTGAPFGQSPREDAADGELHALSAHVAEIAGQVARLARIQVARTRLRARRLAFLALGGILLALVAAAAALAGVRLVVSGLTAGLGEVVGGRVWLAELWSGLLLLAVTAILLVSIRSWSERRLLRDLLRRRESRERARG